MFTNNKLSKAVQVALAFGAVTTAFSASVSAQEEVAAKESVERIAVTGSRIKRTDIETASPVQITTSEDIKISGFTRLEDMMNSLPQIEASETAFLANGATGVATLDLRGMGSERTLVLVNGRRLQPGGIYSQAPDINQIPSALVDRVEVLTGGGSATYGADAVAGVVNFVMKKDFEGVELVAGGSGYQHKNDNKFIQSKMDARDFEYPSGNTGLDGKTATLDLTMGGDIDGGKGHVTAYATWRQVDELRQEARDYSSCALNAGGTACGGSGTTPNPNFYFYPVVNGETDYDQEKYWTLDQNGFIPSSGNVYNYAPVNHFMRPDERFTLGAFANYEVNDNFRPYLEVSFMNDRTVAQIAESGTFYAEEYLLDINNPLFSDTQRDQFRTTFGAGVEQVAAYIGKRNVEGGARASDLEHSSFRIVTGAEGDLTDTWTYDVSFLKGLTSSNVAYLNDFFGPRIGQAIGAEGFDACTGTCIPYEVFTLNGVTAEAADLLKGTAILKGVTSLTVLNGFVSGETGFTVPGHSLPVAAVLGLEHRQEKFERIADEVFAQGLLAGQGGPTPSIVGGYTVREVFGELSIPLIENAAFAQDITLGLGARYSDYSTSGDATTYKTELEWTPTDDWKVRTSYNRAIRAPNVNDLYTPESLGLWSGVDPCAGATPSLSAAQCANTGVTASQYGNIGASPASQYNGVFGGNAELQPEIADTFSFGVVANLFEGFNFSIDYWDIQLEDVIGGIGGQLIVEQCGLTGDAYFCDRITRAPNGSLYLGNNNNVYDPNVNLASRHWRGVDLTANYDVEIAGGRLSTKLVGTQSLKKEYEVIPGMASSTYDCSGNVSVDCFAQPKWRHTLSMSYTTGDWWTATAKWRYFGKVDYVGTTDQLAKDGLQDQSYIDLVGSFIISENVSIMTGVNNVFDREPPMVGSALATNANTVSGYYDTLGRYVHASVTLKF